MNRVSAGAALLLAIVPATLAWAALIGLGLHRHAAPWAVSASATVLLFGPPLAVGAAGRLHRVGRSALAAIAWSLTLLVVLPVYFPGERRSSVATGLAALGLGAGWSEVARQVADLLPEEPDVADPEVAVAVARAAAPPPPPLALEDHQMALPYEGEGRRLSVPVVLQHGDETIEVVMMLDTGATYTTLPSETLAKLGIFPGPSDPVVELQTANGARQASVVLIDRVWLGDLAIEGVSVATCEECAFTDTTGLLGLNVTGGFNLNIDADRREVVFTRRETYDRRLDVRQFSDLSARFTPWPGGRVEVEVTLENLSHRTITSATAEVTCEDATWDVEVGPVEPRSSVTVRRRLPEHEACDRYAIGLSAASW